MVKRAVYWMQRAPLRAIQGVGLWMRGWSSCGGEERAGRRDKSSPGKLRSASLSPLFLVANKSERERKKEG